jgi:hypothetical protein
MVRVMSHLYEIGQNVFLDGQRQCTVMGFNNDHAGWWYDVCIHCGPEEERETVHEQRLYHRKKLPWDDRGWSPDK